MNKEKVLWGVAVVALVLAGWATVRLWPAMQSSDGFGAPGNMLAEQYIPYVLYNGGYNSAKDFSISGSSAFSGAVTMSSTFTVSGISSLGTTTIATTTANNLTVGGVACALTDANGGTYTLTFAQLAGCSSFYFVAGGAGQEVIALTPIATSSMATLLPNAGDCKEYSYSAYQLAAGTTTTFTAASGFNVIAASTNDDVIDGLEYSEWRMCRNNLSDIDWVVSELVNAD